MKYFLFVKFNNGLMHNAYYATLEEVRESAEQLIDDEDLIKHPAEFWRGV